VKLVEIEDSISVNLLEHEKKLLKTLFQNCSKIIINKELGGYSGAKTLLILPIDNDGEGMPPKVVKIGNHDLIWEEFNNYSNNVKDKINRKNRIDLSAPEDSEDKKIAAFFEDFQLGSNWFTNVTLQEVYQKDSKMVGNRMKDLLAVLSTLSKKRKNTFINLGEQYFQRLEEKFITNPSESFKAKREVVYKAMDERILTINNVKYLSVPEHDVSGIEPFHALQTLKSENIQTQTKVVHGDLNSRNILIDNEIVLIDYAKTKQDHHVKDIAKLEATLKFEVLKGVSLDKRLRFEKIVTSKFQLSESDIHNSGMRADLERLFMIIKKIRGSLNITEKAEELDDPSGFFSALFFYTLSVLSFREKISSESLCHAYISAGLIAKRIEKEYGFSEKKPSKSKFLEGFALWKKGTTNILGRSMSTFLAHPYSLQSNFTGRVEERKTLTEWFCHDEKHPILSLTAIGGMGKSALSWVWLNLDVLGKSIPGIELDTPEAKQECNIPEDEKPEGIFQWSFYLGELSFNKFLMEACKYTGGEPKSSQEEPEITDYDRLRTLSSRLRERRYLFILDGFERLLRAYGSQDAVLLSEKDLAEYSEDERRCSDITVSRFLEEVCAGGKSKVLLTTRLVPYELDGKAGFRDYPLEGLNDDDAAIFLKSNRIKGLDRELKAAANVYKNHPLSLGHLVNVLHDDVDAPDDIRQAPQYDVSMSVKARREQILRRSFEILPDDLKKKLTRISAVRGSVTYEFISLVNPGISKSELQTTLSTLEDMRWVFWDRDKKNVSFHPLARRYCYRELKERKEKLAVHEILRDYWEKKANKNLPSISSVLKAEEIQAIIKKRDELAKHLHPEQEVGLKTIRDYFGRKKINERVPLLDLIFEHLIKGKNQNSVLFQIAKYFDSLGNKTPTISDILTGETIKKIVEIRDSIAKEVLDKDFARKMRETNLFPEKKAGFTTLEEFFKNTRITEDVWLLSHLFRDEDGNPVDPFLALAITHLKTFGDDCPTLADIFEDNFFDIMRKARGKMVELEKKGEIKIDKKHLVPEKGSKYRTLKAYLMTRKIIEPVPLLEILATLQAKGEVDIVANHVAMYYRKFPKQAPMVTGVMEEEEIKKIVEARDKMAKETKADAFKSDISKDDLYPEQKEKLKSLEELFKTTKITERLKLLDIVLSIEDLNSVNWLISEHLKSLGDDVPTIRDVLSNEEIKSIAESQKQLETIFFPEKEKGYENLEELLRKMKVNERIPMLDTIFGKNAVPVYYGRVKFESLEEFQPVIELYHHTVGVERYDEASSLLQNRLVPYPLHYQFGAYSTIIELGNTLFEDPPRCRKCKIEKPLVQAWLYNSLASSYSLFGQPRRAVLMYETDIAILKKLEDKKTIPIPLGNLAILQVYIGDLESAESNQKRYVRIVNEFGMESEYGDSYRELGRTHLYLGAFEEFETELARAIELFEKKSYSQGIGISCAYRAFRSLLMNKPSEGVKWAEKALEFAEKDAAETYPFPRDFIQARWLLGTAHTALKEPKKAESHFDFAITECQKINLVEMEANILLSFAKLRHFQKRDDESLKLADKALEIANRCGYVLQQADIHLFLGEFFFELSKKTRRTKQVEGFDVERFLLQQEITYKDLSKTQLKELAVHHANRAKLRSHQMIDVETGDYITKPEDTKWKYKPCYDKAVKLLKKLGVKLPKPKSTKKRGKKKTKRDFQTGYV